MKKSLLLILAIVAFAMTTVAQVPEALTKVTSAYNSKCPIDVAEGTTLTKVEVADDSVVFNQSVDDQLFDSLESLKSILHDSYLAEMESSPDPNTQNLMSLCKSLKLNIVQRFVNSKGKQFEVVISHTEL